MPSAVREGNLQEAREELARYLSDEIAPMMAAESVSALVMHPDALLFAGLQAWVDSQIRRPGQRLGSADFVFHALRKLLEMTELELVPQGPLLARIEECGKRFLHSLPADQARLLRRYLEELGAAEPGLGSKIEVIHRPASVTGAHRVLVPPDEEPPTGPARAGGTTGTFAVQPSPPETGAPSRSADYGPSLQRLGLIMERLEQRLAQQAPGSGGSANPETMPPPAAATHAISSAAVGARSAEELEALLDRLERMGVDTRLEQIFRSLGEQVPGWTLEPGGAGKAIPEAKSLQAMQRLIDLAEDDAEISRRFHQLVAAAVDRLASGALVQAAKMFDLAEKVALEQEIPSDAVESVCRSAGKSLELARLVELAGDQKNHALLGRALSFFPRFGVSALLTKLFEEECREVRYQLLALVRVYGSAARPSICDQLRLSCDDAERDPYGFYRRNLVFLLRRIPVPEGDDRSEEFAQLARCARADAPLILVKETVGALCTIRDQAAERILTQLLRDLENALLGSNRSGHEPHELCELLDRVTAGLAKRESIASARHVANHALRSEPALGNALARIANLGARDLSDDPELVKSLVAHLEAALPKKVLGVVVARDNPAITPLVKALAHTFDPLARRTLESIAARYTGRDFGEIAARAMRRSSPPAEPEVESAPGSGPPLEAEDPETTGPAPSGAASTELDGDLDLFGLPNLLQSLHGSRVTGTLVLCDESGDEVARIELAEGLLMRCFAGDLAGEQALFQLLERPAPGRFHFTSDPKAADGEPQLGQPIDPLALVLEGLRRHDELQQALAIVPDGARFEGTETKPTLPEGCEDRERARGVWHMVRAGEAPEVCESRLALDAYSVRSLITHWVEVGALRMKAS